MQRVTTAMPSGAGFVTAGRINPPLVPSNALTPPAKLDFVFFFWPN